MTSPPTMAGTQSERPPIFPADVAAQEVVGAGSAG